MTFGSSPALSNILIECLPRPNVYSSILQYLFPIKTPFFGKILMLSLHVIYGLGPYPQTKILATSVIATNQAKKSQNRKFV